jgi:hypothetical protein
MANFLNFSVNSGISFNSFRIPTAISCGSDFGDWLKDVEKNEYDSVVSIGDVEECIELLESGSYWNNSDISSDTIDTIHKFLLNYR